MFNNLKKIKPKSTVAYKLPEIFPSKNNLGVIIYLREANDRTNKKYLKYILDDKEFKEYRNKVKKTETKDIDKMTFDDVDVKLVETLQQNRRLLANALIEDWENVIDDEGKEVKFSEEVALEFVNSLDDAFIYDMFELIESNENFRFYEKAETRKKK